MHMKEEQPLYFEGFVELDSVFGNVAFGYTLAANFEENLDR